MEWAEEEREMARERARDGKEREQAEGEREMARERAREEKEREQAGERERLKKEEGEEKSEREAGGEEEGRLSFTAEAPSPPQPGERGGKPSSTGRWPPARAAWSREPLTPATGWPLLQQEQRRRL
jgi:hypothetical protein